MNEQEKIQRLTSLLKKYEKRVVPLISIIETQEQHFPPQVLNEIRDILTHLTRAYFAQDDEFIHKNFNQASVHYSRATRDCLKILCISFQDAYKSFCRTYKNLDLSLVDNGEFLRNLTNQLSKADELYLSAKQKDHRGDDEKKVVKAYQTAYLAYVELQRIQKRASAKIEHLKNKQKSRSIWHIVWNVISVIGVILTILQFFGIYIKIWN